MDSIRAGSWTSGCRDGAASRCWVKFVPQAKWRLMASSGRQSFDLRMITCWGAKVGDLLHELTGRNNNGMWIIAGFWFDKKALESTESDIEITCAPILRTPWRRMVTYILITRLYEWLPTRNFIFIESHFGIIRMTSRIVRFLSSIGIYRSKSREQPSFQISNHTEEHFPSVVVAFINLNIELPSFSSIRRSTHFIVLFYVVFDGLQIDDLTPFYLDSPWYLRTSYWTEI